MRMVVITLRPLLRDIIAALLRTRTPDTVADLARRVPPDEVKSLMPDLIVVGLRKGERDRIGRKYATCIPAATVLVLSSDGRDAFLYKATTRVALCSISPDDLTDVLADSIRSN
jgi:hypothetical protein